MQEWGRRLSDALRSALESQDLTEARRLALEGDGQTRGLAKEYTFMVRGLGITIALLLRLLGETVARADAEAGAAAAAELKDLIQRFRTELAQLMSSSAEPSPTPDAEMLSATQALEETQAWFQREQALLADEIVGAIERSDGTRALKLIDSKEAGQYLPLHDRLVRFMADSFGWVLKRFGPDGLLRFHLATAEGQRSGFEKWEGLPAADFARTTAFLLKQHMGHVAVTEDDDKFTIDQAPCGSGGRLLLNGAYSGADCLPFVEIEGPLTFGQPRIPVYCSHCAIWNGAATLRWFGRAQWVFEQPARPDGGCRLHIYKRPDDAPPDYAERVAVREEQG